MPRTTRTAVVCAAVALLSSGVVGAPAHADRPVADAATLDRGVVSVRSGDGNFVSWRQLATDADGPRFNVYRDGRKVNAAPVGTNFVDA
ncbi:MAG: rhamnogalacturonan lyase, partial [Actinomycetota bacterium]|nr:rhamnogalacturonan lyase [Actinomycetota bacterium]